MPWDLTSAIDHAVRVCSWQENLFGEDMPPSWMWPFDDPLESWFIEVERRRGYDSSPGETTDMMDNEFADRFKS